MAFNEIIITHETLFELLRLERSRTELQKLPEDFEGSISQFLKESATLIQKGVDERAQMSLNNTKKILKELHDRREKKVVNLAMTKSRTQAAIVETDSFLSHEKSIYEAILALLGKERERFYKQLENPFGQEGFESALSDKKEELAIQNDNQGKPGEVMISFVEDVPAFLDANLNKVGPFVKDTKTTLDKSIAEILVKSKKAIYPI